LRARARLFEDFADNSFTPQVGQLMAELHKGESEQDPARIQRLRQSIERVLDYLNHELQGQQYLASEFSVADIGFVPRLLVLSALQIEPGANRPNVDLWLKRMLERGSIQGLEGVTIEPGAGI
jgi:glutathione S-transferase